MYEELPIQNQTDMNARFNDMMAANNFISEHNPSMINPMDAFQGFESLNYDALQGREEEINEAVGEINLRAESFSVDALHAAHTAQLARQARVAAQAFEAEHAQRMARLQMDILDKESAKTNKKRYSLAA